MFHNFFFYIFFLFFFFYEYSVGYCLIVGVGNKKAVSNDDKIHWEVTDGIDKLIEKLFVFYLNVEEKKNKWENKI